MASSKSSKAKQSKDQEGDRLPFEPNSSKKKSAKVRAIPASKSKQKSRASREGGIPEIVSKRMAKRMAIFCGVPTLIGLATLPSSYFLITQNIVNLPHTAVLLFSLLCLGLSVVGLTYGVLSASWDEPDPGSILGIQEFQLNLGRVIESWKSRQ